MHHIYFSLNFGNVNCKLNNQILGIPQNVSCLYLRLNFLSNSTWFNHSFVQFAVMSTAQVLFKVKLHQDYQVCDGCCHKWMQQFHVDVEKATSKMKWFALCDRLCVDDFNLHGIEKSEAHEKSSGGFTKSTWWWNQLNAQLEHTQQ